MDQNYKEHIYLIRYLLYILYPGYNSYLFFLYIVVQYLKDMERRERYKDDNPHQIGLGIKIVPQSIIKKIAQNCLKSISFTTFHQIVVPREYFDDLYAENIYFRDDQSLWTTMRVICKEEQFLWLNNDRQFSKMINTNLKSLSPKRTSNMRNSVVQILPCDNLDICTAYMSEEAYFNITRNYKSRFISNDDVRIKFLPIADVKLGPQIAESAVISMVTPSTVINTDLVHVLLESYFNTPKFVHEGDYFTIPLNEQFMKHLYFKYFDLANELRALYFVCDKLSNKNISAFEKETGKQFEGTVGYFIVKGITELTQRPNINSFVPFSLFYDVKTTNEEYSYISQCPFGFDGILNELDKCIKPFLLNKDVNPFYANLKCIMQPIFLLRGNKGAGCKLLTSILARKNGMNFISVDCHQLSASTAKQTEAKLEALIEKAKNCAPVLIFMENFEVFAVDFENNENVRVIESFTIRLKTLYENFTKLPIVIFAGCDTNAELKTNLLRIFLEQINVENLNRENCFDTLKWFALLKNMSVCNDEFIPIQNNSSGNFIVPKSKITDCKSWDFIPECKLIYEKISSKFESHVYDDLDSLIHLTLRCGFVRSGQIGLFREIDFDDSLEVLRTLMNKKLTPLKIPNVKWEDIGGLEDLKREIFRTIELPLKFPHLLANSGLKRSGILLWGPPGCGKTLVARAVASQLKANFLSVKGSELLDMYVGQSEKNMREIFASARSSAPCVIFFDEAEAAAGARGASGDSGGAADRLVSQLLAELDGVAAQSSDKGSVVVIAATNRPDLVEPALLRPGRLDKLLYVGPYEGNANKIRVLHAACHGCNLDEDVDLNEIAQSLPEKCTGADLASIVKRARHLALRKVIEKAELGKINPLDLTEDVVVVQQNDFFDSLKEFNPSISSDEMNYYESLKYKLL